MTGSATTGLGSGSGCGFGAWTISSPRGWSGRSSRCASGSSVRERLGELLSLLECSDGIERILHSLLHDEQQRDELRRRLERYILETGDEAAIESRNTPLPELEAGTTTSAREPNLLEELCGLSRSAWYRVRQRRFPRNLACFLDQFPTAPEDAPPISSR